VANAGDALTGLESLWDRYPGLQPGLSNAGPSALKFTALRVERLHLRA